MSAEDGFPHFEELAPSEASMFKSHIRRAKKASTYGAAVDIHPVGAYKQMRMFATRDGMAGYAVSPEGELNSVFKHPDAPYEKVAQRAAEHAVLMAGATHASAFDPVLPEMYRRGGLSAVASTPWVEDYKPAGWRTSKQGRPDVVFMAADRDAAHPSEPSYKPGAAPLKLSGDDAYDIGMSRSASFGASTTRKQLPTAPPLLPRNSAFFVGHSGARR
jgi:hypothetical protein